ncbi:MAG: helix-turn-helix domain-containing protein [Deltaproteobacteria bacterium]|nr:helix-turn-helix domain-containing protein [Deltaproteobacteria bacterium]
MQENLFPEMPQKTNDNTKMIGANLSLVFNRSNKNLVTLKNRDLIVKKVDLSDKPAKKLLVIEVVELGATKSRLAEALNISRQTIHNYIESKKRFGAEGLLGGYDPNMGKNLAEHRKRTQANRIQGTKAVILAEERKAKRIENQKKQLELDFEFGEKAVAKDEQSFNILHDWKFTRFAGIFPYLIVLISQNQWLKLVMGYFGSAYKIFSVFLLMAARNIKSIEQLKNVNLKEAGLILGLNKLPSKKGVWQWFYAACDMRRSTSLCKSFFKQQLRCGLVGAWIWFTDGHLLPYTGYRKVHYGFNTQRKMAMPGQTNMVTCDISGRIVDFQIQEGKGDLKTHIVELKKKWEQELTQIPFMVFDREGYGAPFFNTLIENEIPFVTWEKHVDSKKLKALDDDCFTESFEMNNKNYRIFEGEKRFTLEQNGKTQTLALRKIYLWNQTSRRRTCGLAWDAGRSISTLECAQAILSRWGASENTFKHLYDRHPFHYHPGFKTGDSENQLIANPAIKSIEKEIKDVRKTLDKKHKKNSKAKEVFNKDGSRRENSLKARLEAEISDLEAQYTKLLDKKKQLPGKVDVSTLQDYKSFKKIDNEGKNLFDFVTASVWNARKEMTDWLLCHYPNEDEYVDLFYAITKCHGWIKSEADRVVVRLEPLQQPSRRKAQEQLCKKLNALSAYIPIGKILQIEVGQSPIEKR